MALSIAYSPQATVYVKTQVLSSSGKADDSEARIWQITSDSQAQSGAYLSFFPENGNTPFCQVRLSATGQFLDSQLPGAAGNALQTPEFLFVPGYPAPCDIFPSALLNSAKADASVSYEVNFGYVTN